MWWHAYYNNNNNNLILVYDRKNCYNTRVINTYYDLNIIYTRSYNIASRYTLSLSLEIKIAPYDWSLEESIFLIHIIIILCHRQLSFYRWKFDIEYKIILIFKIYNISIISVTRCKMNQCRKIKFADFKNVLWNVRIFCYGSCYNNILILYNTWSEIMNQFNTKCILGIGMERRWLNMYNFIIMPHWPFLRQITIHFTV